MLAIDDMWAIVVMIMIEDVSNDLESGGEKDSRGRWLQYLKRPLQLCAKNFMIYDLVGVSFIRGVSPLCLRRLFIVRKNNNP